MVKSRVDDVKRQLGELTRSLRAEGKRLAGYGAAAKGTILLNFVALYLVSYAVDGPLQEAARLFFALAAGSFFTHFFGMVTGADMVRLAYLMVDSNAVAEELVQDAFVKAFSRLETYRADQGKFSNWVFKIAHNTTIDHLRRSRVTTVPIDAGGEGDVDFHSILPDESASTPLEGAVRMDLAKALDARVIATGASDAKLKLVDKMYAPDAVVNAAGAFSLGSFAETDPADFDLQLSANLRGPFLVTRAFINSMIERGSGSIVSVCNA